MREQSISSLAKKSFLFFLVISFLAISLMGLIWHRYNLKSQHDFIEQSLINDTRLISMAMRPALSLHDRQYALETLVGMQQRGRFDTIQVFDRDHKLLTAIGKFTAAPLQQQFHRSEATILHRNQSLVVIQPISLDDEEFGHIVTITDEPTLARHLKHNYPVIFSGMAVTFLITVLLALVANRRYEKIYRRNEMLVDELGEKNVALQQAKNEADEANAAKDTFLANVSHELRTPLNGILGMNQLLKQSGLGESQQEFSDSIRNSARHLLTIVEQLLDLSMIESDRDEPRNEAFSPSELVADVIRAKQLQAMQKGLQLTCHMDATVPAIIESDATRLSQVLSNVIDNAIKYTAEGFVRLQVQRETDHLLLQVHDSGPGIDTADQQRIFDNFFRGNHSEPDPASGIGLGLTICKKLLHKVGGDIRVESRPGEGSTFYIRFPYTPCNGYTPQLPGWIRHITILSKDEWLTSEIKKYIDILDPANSVPVSTHLTDTDLAHTLLLTDSRISMLPKAAEGAAQIQLQQAGEEDTCVCHCLVFPCSLQSLVKAMERITPPAKPSFGSPAIARARVLIVEDNAINRKIAHAALRHLDVEILEATNGREAVAITERLSPDCILMDIRMPEMDGISATREIRRHTDAAQLPIIGITAHALQSEIEKALAAGMNRVVTKPIDIHALALDVETVLAERHELLALPEIGCDALLHDLGDDTAIYHEVLEELEHQLSQLLPLLDALFANGDKSALTTELDRLSDALATIHADKPLQQLQRIASALPGEEMKGLRPMWQQLREEIGHTVHLLQQARLH